MGCLPAEVTDLDDPLKAGRIRCKSALFDPHSNLTSGTDGWIQVITDYVNTNRPGGKVTPLDIGSQVILIPILGRPDNWICLGALHSIAEPPSPLHDRAKGAYGSVDNAGVSTISEADGSETKIFPQGVRKTVTAKGDIEIQTPEVQVSYGADGAIGLQNPAGSLTMNNQGVVEVVSDKGGNLTFDTEGTVKIGSGHSSTMTFGASGTTVTGPEPKKKSQATEYAEKISSNIEGLGSAFKDLNLTEVSAANIESVVSTVREAVGKISQISEDFQAGVGSLKDLSSKPLAEIIEGISPQVSTYLEANLTRIIPEIQSALGDNLPAEEITNKINQLIPGQLTQVSSGDIERILTDLKGNRDILLEAIVGQVVPFSSVKNIFGSKLALKLPEIEKLLIAPAPTWEKEPQRCTELLFEADIKRVAELIPGLGYLANLPPGTTSLGDLREGLNTVIDQDLINQAVSIFWIESQARKILKISNKIDLQTLRTAVGMANKGEVSEAMALILAANQQAITGDGEISSSKMLGLVSNASRLEYSLGLIDQGEYGAGFYEAVIIGKENTQYKALNSLARLVDREVVESDLPIRDREGNIQRAISGWANRWEEEALKEDSLCREAIRTVISQWRASFEKSFFQKDPIDEIYYKNLIRLVDNFIELNQKTTLSYPGAGKIFTDLTQSIDKLVEDEQALDREEAIVRLRQYYRREEASRAAQDTVKRNVNRRQGYKPNEVITAERTPAVTDVLNQFVADRKLAVPDEGVGCSQIPFVAWDLLSLEVEVFIEKMRVANNSGGKQVVTFADLRGLPLSFEAQTADYSLVYGEVEDITTGLASVIDDYLTREVALERESYFSQLAFSPDPVSLAEKLDPGIVGTASYELISSEYKKMISAQFYSLAEKNPDYINSATSVLNDFQAFIDNWIAAWKRVSRSETAGFTILADLQAQVVDFVNSRNSLTDRYADFNLLWDEVRQTTNYLVSYKETIDNFGSGNIDRSFESSSSTGLPGGFLAKPAAPNKDWITAAVEIVRAISDSVLEFVPEYKDWHGKVSQVLNSIPISNTSPAIILNAGKIDMKSSQTGRGSTVSLDSGSAKISAANGKSNLDLGAGSAAISTGAGGGEMKLGSGSGAMTVGGGSLNVNMFGASLSGIGSSVFAGAGSAGFSSPFGFFGFGPGGGGGGIGGGEDFAGGLDATAPIRFRVAEADFDGGSVEISLSPKRGARMASYDAYSNYRNAEIQLFDGRISLTTYIQNQPAHHLLLSSQGVSIDGYSLTELYSRHDTLNNRVNTLAALVDTLGSQGNP